MKNLESIKEAQGQYQRSLNREFWQKQQKQSVTLKELGNISKINSLLLIRKKLFLELNGKTKESNEIPDADQSRVFWSGIWGESKERNGNAEWLKKLKEENNYQKQQCVFITKEIVSKQRKKIPNWKALEGDGVQGFWIKKLTSLHE